MNERRKIEQDKKKWERDWRGGCFMWVVKGRPLWGTGIHAGAPVGEGAGDAYIWGNGISGKGRSNYEDPDTKTRFEECKYMYLNL